ncbi:putative basic proline-rich protein-like [Iris pallida]|uniref:Basic proline-rich protein-like n=1 Tax=Iris pallida TaxID=29817 RepID=A0AAX6F492_IRIPA|nr:putative basic proline-rich protein-like [Iris pallida]KAJ6816324.1 putative basic proline-rich protein-like [Iris pallida]
MVLGSLWEFGISDVVFFWDFRKGPVDYFGFTKYFGNGFWYVLVSGNFRERSVTCRFGIRLPKLFRVVPIILWIGCGCFIYIKCGFFPGLGLAGIIGAIFPVFGLTKNRGDAARFFRKS